MRPLRRAAIPALLLAAAGCRHALPPAPLPADWLTLVRPPRPFAALYRFSCCGRRDLVLTVRGDERAVAVSVAIPPGGAALAAWVDAEGGWVYRAKERCREPLPQGMLPLSASAALPLDPGMTALLLSGLLPEGTRELPGEMGWVGAAGRNLWWRARVAGPEAHWTRMIVGRNGEADPLVVAERREPETDPGLVPHDLVLKAGSVKAELTLREWRSSDPAAPPGWMSAPACGAGS